MFYVSISLSFIPWSILNLKEKSGRVILAKLNSFRSHVVNKHTALEDPSFSKCSHAGRHSTKEILRICMYRTPEHPKSSRTRRLGAFPWDALVYELLSKVRMSDKIEQSQQTSMISQEDWANKSRYNFDITSSKKSLNRK